MAVLYVLYETTDRTPQHMVKPCLHHIAEQELRFFDLSETYQDGYTQVAQDMLQDLKEQIINEKYKDLIADLQSRIKESNINQLCVSCFVMDGSIHKTIALSDGVIDDTKIQIHLTNCDVNDQLKLFESENEKLYNFMFHYDPSTDDHNNLSFKKFIKDLYNVEHYKFTGEDFMNLLTGDPYMRTVFTTQAFFKNIPSIEGPSKELMQQDYEMEQS